MQTNNPKLVVLGLETSKANNAVTIGFGPNRTPWRCLVKRGIVVEVMSLTDEGKLRGDRNLEAKLTKLGTDSINVSATNRVWARQF